MDRDQQPRVTLEDVLSSVKREYAKAKYCLHPDAGKNCSGRIIQAHTIQKNGGLDKIAENGKVMNFSGSGATILKRGRITTNLIGIRDASTFTGFCGRHDSETFKPIETQPFCGNKQQCFLLAYRAICHELYERQISVGLVPAMRMMDKGSHENKQLAYQQHMDQFEHWQTYRRNCTQFHKEVYDKVLNSEDYSLVKWYIINLPECPDILCSAALCPRFDFAGTLIQDADTRRIFDIITCSIIPVDAGGAIVFSWVGQSRACQRFVQSLHAYEDKALVQAVVRLLFYSVRTMYSRPAWWNNLDRMAQGKLIQRREIGMSPEHSLHPSAYKDDGLESVDWKIKSRETNIVGLRLT